MDRIFASERTGEPSDQGDLRVGALAAGLIIRKARSEKPRARWDEAITRAAVRESGHGCPI